MVQKDLDIANSKKCRADWDITTPELKAAWQQGRTNPEMLVATKSVWDSDNTLLAVPRLLRQR